MNILILEDDPVSLKKLSHDLAKLGHQVLEATDSVAALNLYYEHPTIDAVITDLEMPFGSGIDFVREIREINKEIPIFVVSGQIDKNSLLALKKYFCTDILVKPHDKARLKKMLEII